MAIDSPRPRGNQVVKQNARRADNHQRQRRGNQQNQHRLDEKLDNRWRHFFGKTLHPRHQPHGQNDRQHRPGVIGKQDVDTDKIDRFTGRQHLADAGMQQHARESHRQNRVAFKLQRRPVGQQHRQEEEGGVGNDIEQLPGRAGFANHAGKLENGQQRFNHPRAGDRRDHRGKCGRDDADNPRNDAGRFGVFIAAGRAFLLRQGLIEQAINPLHLIADNNLELAALLHDADHAGDSANLRIVNLRAVVELHAQPGRAMGEHADILRTAHRVEDFVCCFVIVHSVPWCWGKKKDQNRDAPLGGRASLFWSCLLSQ